VPKDLSLRRFWFPIPGHLGIGVTAASRAEAEVLASNAAAELHWPFVAAGVIEDVDVRDLDQGHVVPNMAPPNWRGVWFPRF
jgi:hypothetical protein